MAMLVGVPDRVVAKTISNGYQLDYFRLSYVLRFVADTVGLVALLNQKRKTTQLDNIEKATAKQRNQIKNVFHEHN